MQTKVLNFPVKEKTVSEEDLLKLELRKAQTEALLALSGTQARKDRVKEMKLAAKKLQEYYDSQVNAEVIDHPMVKHYKLIKTLKTSRMVIMVKMQEYIHKNDLANPEYLKLSRQMGQIEARIELIETNPKKGVNYV